MEFPLLAGLASILHPVNLWYCFLGAVLGTLVGVLPGLGPASTLAMLLPLTTFIPPTGAVIMLAGIYYGAAYGGSTTSILLNIPGEPSSVATCIDGFQMTRDGRGGQALWIAAVGSFIAGTLGSIMMSVVGPVLAAYALRFGPPEYFGLMVFSLTTLISLSAGSTIRAIGAGLLGIFLATIGLDPLSGTGRLNYGSVELLRGFNVVPIAVGLFGIGEIIFASEQGIVRIYEGTLGRMIPRGADLRRGLLASMRGTLIGYGLGLLPGMVTALTPFMAYDLEKRVSRSPEKFGTGVIEGVASPEAANNATAMAGFIPLMALGIPTSPALAILLAALLMYGLQPGPVLFQQNQAFIWTVIASMYVGNVMLLILNLPLVGLWVRLCKIPYKILSPIMLAICVVGAYSPRNVMFDVWVALGFGILGYLMRKWQWPVAPLILGFILGDMLEQALRQSLGLSAGSLLIFMRRPISAGLIAATVLWLVLGRRVASRVLPRREAEADE